MRYKSVLFLGVTAAMGSMAMFKIDHAALELGTNDQLDCQALERLMRFAQSQERQMWFAQKQAQERLMRCYQRLDCPEQERLMLCAQEQENLMRFVQSQDRQMWFAQKQEHLMQLYQRLEEKEKNENLKACRQRREQEKRRNKSRKRYQRQKFLQQELQQEQGEEQVKANQLLLDNLFGLLNLRKWEKETIDVILMHQTRDAQNTFYQQLNALNIRKVREVPAGRIYALSNELKTAIKGEQRLIHQVMTGILKKLLALPSSLYEARKR